MDDKDIVILGGSGSDSITVTDTITLDLDFGAAEPALSTSGIDTITLDDINMSSTITLPSSSYVIGGTGGTSYTYSSGNSFNWNSSLPPSVNITGNGIEMPAGSDIKIDGQSLKDFMTKMEQRLAILVPDPEKLEKFEALKKAYEHYKTMEALCFPDEKDKENEC
jgi:hypothetical protein